MRRTVRFRAADDGNHDNLLGEEDTLAFRLTPGYEHAATQLGVCSGTRVRIELVDDGGHLLDSRIYHAE